jgi:sugar lactone lactonase YvrE
MKKMLLVFVYSICSCFAYAGLVDVKLSTLWTQKGFSKPESVVYDAKRNLLYVSNIHGSPSEKDGIGSISKVSFSMKGSKISDKPLVEGLDSPKGMAIYKDKLYVADITDLIVINLETGAVGKKYPGEKAVFLNDVTVDDSGRILVSDTFGNAIYVLEKGTFTRWLTSEDLDGPNGLYAESNRLVVATWGSDGLGSMKTVSYSDKSISDLGKSKSVGNLDGLEPDGFGNYFVTDYSTGKLLLISPAGDTKMLTQQNIGAADLTYIPGKKMILIPLMNNDGLIAFSVEFPSTIKKK